jgi:hypothetical protein
LTGVSVKIDPGEEMKKSIFAFLMGLLASFGAAIPAYLHSSAFTLESSYAIENSWSSGYQVNVALTNNTATPIDSSHPERAHHKCHFPISGL